MFLEVIIDRFQRLLEADLLPGLKLWLMLWPVGVGGVE
jgi:hypothetical protein